MYVEDKNMNMIIEARSTHVYRRGGPYDKEDCLVYVQWK